MFFVITHWYSNKTSEDILIHIMNVYFEGILSFLSAPLIGALSDIWGRKFFLLGRGSSLFSEFMNKMPQSYSFLKTR
jgi:hypothetical protein